MNRLVTYTKKNEVIAIGVERDGAQLQRQVFCMSCLQNRDMTDIRSNLRPATDPLNDIVINDVNPKSDVMFNNCISCGHNIAFSAAMMPSISDLTLAPIDGSEDKFTVLCYGKHNMGVVSPKKGDSLWRSYNYEQSKSLDSFRAILDTWLQQSFKRMKIVKDTLNVKSMSIEEIYAEYRKNQRVIKLRRSIDSYS